MKDRYYISIKHIDNKNKYKTGTVKSCMNSPKFSRVNSKNNWVFDNIDILQS